MKQCYICKMYFVLIISIILLIVVWFGMRPKAVFAERREPVKKPPTFTEVMLSEGYTIEQANEYAYNMAKAGYKSDKNVRYASESDLDSFLDELITAKEYFNLESVFKQCYTHTKIDNTFQKYCESDNVYFETDIQMYRLKKEYKNMSESELTAMLRGFSKEKEKEFDYDF